MTCDEHMAPLVAAIWAGGSPSRALSDGVVVIVQKYEPSENEQMFALGPESVRTLADSHAIAEFVGELRQRTASLGAGIGKPRDGARTQGAALLATRTGRTAGLAQCLIDTGLAAGEITLNQGVRSPKIAHQWSTSWNIRKMHVSLKALQALKDGKDADGNIWYVAAWEDGLKAGKEKELDGASLKKLWEKIFANAATYYPSSAVAAEGYRQSDSRVKPNVHKAVSNHVDGRAMDVSIPWKSGAKVFGRTISNGENSEEPANRLVRAFGLSRPVKSERWHFQLPSDESRGFVPENNLGVDGPTTWPGIPWA